MRAQKFFIGAVSREHTKRGESGGFMQVCHGKQAPLKRMQKGDWIIFYSSKISMQGEEKCQAFTAIGQACDADVYAFEMSPEFVPFRRNVSFYPCEETAIAPLIPHLEFIPDKKHWGYPFRFGFFEIGEKDFHLIASHMLPNEF
jgi:hypothetical protein